MTHILGHWSWHRNIYTWALMPGGAANGELWSCDGATWTGVR